MTNSEEGSRSVGGWGITFGLLGLSLAGWWNQQQEYPAIGALLLVFGIVFLALGLWSLVNSPVDLEVLEKRGSIRGLARALRRLKEGWRRAAAASALGRLGKGSAARHLERAVIGDKDAEVRQAAVVALSAVGDGRKRTTIQRLLMALDDTEWRVRRAAAAALDQLGWEPSTADVQVQGSYHAAKRDWVWSALEGDTRARGEAVSELSRRGDVEAATQLVDVLRNDWDSRVRAAAAGALGSIGDPQSLKALVRSLGDGTWEVRKAAVRALDELHWSPSDEVESASYLAVKNAVLCPACQGQGTVLVDSDAPCYCGQPYVDAAGFYYSRDDPAVPGEEKCPAHHGGDLREVCSNCRGMGHAVT